MAWKDTEYEGEGRRRKAWWRQEATEKNFGPPWQICGKLKEEEEQWVDWHVVGPQPEGKGSLGGKLVY